MSQPEIITFGCRLNACEAEAMRALAAKAGLKDAVIVNTCAVTNEAVRQARQAIRKAHRARPDTPILVTGCAAQVEPAAFAGLPGVARVIGNAEKMAESSYTALDAREKILVNDIMSVKETAWHMADSFPGRVRAYVQIQNGCDHRCTFCIIPFGRGNSRSIGVGEILRQVERLVGNGYREIILTGVDIASFGKDLPGEPTLGYLVQKILAKVPELARLRLSSLDAVEVDEALIEALQSEKRLMPHLHLSLQAGSDMILKRMKRRHTRSDAIAFTGRLRAARSEIVFGADFIAGFPTETDAMFEETLSLVDACGLNFLHVFPYSAKAGTPAARMPQVAARVRKERARQLREKGAAADGSLFRRLAGKKETVLIERAERGFSFGHGENFAPIRVAGGHAEGALLPVTMSLSPDGSLTAADV
ncbi:MAG TPA: tRNA (N(6)-L-threonylcarbamoyladenosine(37)-C(2))-methylthiotransferase MtaB [Sphingomonadales bacterium]|nr:tRNA (N(6)-L-threonylcarbamoyladenosine(37)-C(2))-methylthiotransferase MtaB [Sphingomonadales bacterium]